MSNNTYALYCQTEGNIVYANSPSVPTQCPNNIHHIINTSTITQVHNILGLHIEEDAAFTGKNVRFEGFQFGTINASNTGTINISYQYPKGITILRFYTITSNDQEDDVIQAYINKDVKVGDTTVAHNISDTIINVPSGASIFKVGYNLILDDGVNSEDLGQVINVDGDNITVENACSYNFAIGTDIKISIHFAKNFTLGPSGNYETGASISNFNLPLNSTITVEYTNNGGSAKNPKFFMEYFY